MKKRTPANNTWSVLRVVEIIIALAEQIDALIGVPMDSNFTRKLRLKSMAICHVSAHVPVMNYSSFSMKNGTPARTSSVLRVVDSATALDDQIDALMDTVSTDYTLITKQLSKLMAIGEKSELVRVMTNTCSLMKRRMPVRTTGVLSDVDIETAMSHQIDALTTVHTDYSLSMKQMLSSRALIGQSDHVIVMTNTSSLTKKRMHARSSTVMKVVENATAIRKNRNA